MSDPSPVTPKILGQIAQLRADLHDRDDNSRRHNYHTATNGELFAKVAKTWKDKGHQAFNINCAIFGLSPSSMRLKLVHGLNWLADNTTGTDKDYWDQLRSRIRFNITGTQLKLWLRADIGSLLQFVTASDAVQLWDSLERWVASNPRIGTKWPDGGAVDLPGEAVTKFTRRMMELETQDFVGIVSPTELQFIRVAPGTITPT